jgi:hypothetical protein
MKKLAFTLVACLAFVQSHAATSALTESLLEYQAITNFIGEPTFDTIPATEFIIDISRITHEVAILGTVEYEIVTRILSDNGSVPNLAIDMHESIHTHHHKHCHENNTHAYIAVLNVSPNPGIGPNNVTVISITPAFD